MVAQAHEERLVLVTDEHWIKYVAPGGAAAALLAVSVLFFLSARSNQPGASEAALFLFGVVFLLCALHILFHSLLSERVSMIAVTSKRVIRTHQSLLLNDDMSEISLEKMQAVYAEKHGILQNVLGYGTINFKPHGSVTRVPHPHRVAKHVMQVLDMK